MILTKVDKAELQVDASISESVDLGKEIVFTEFKVDNSSLTDKDTQGLFVVIEENHLDKGWKEVNRTHFLGGAVGKDGGVPRGIIGVRGEVRISMQLEKGVVISACTLESID